jgi:hypothetical protein
LYSSAQPAEPDAFELGEEAGKLVPGQDIAVESDLGGPPALNDGKQAGDATCVFDQATREAPPSRSAVGVYDVGLWFSTKPRVKRLHHGATVALVNAKAFLGRKTCLVALSIDDEDPEV